MSLTLARAAPPGTALPVAERILGPSLGTNLSSTGLEADLNIGRAPVRLPDTAGSLEVVPLLVEVDREGGFWRVFETAEAIGSCVGEETKLWVAVSTPRYVR